jgi:hypothetical protein
MRKLLPLLVLTLFAAAIGCEKPIREVRVPDAAATPALQHAAPPACHDCVL